MDNVTVTERAARQIGEILRREAPGTMLRVSVEGGGCSGFQYKFDMDAAQADDDVVIARDGATVLIDPGLAQLPGRLRDRLRRRPDRRLVQDQQSAGDRVLRLRHELFALTARVSSASARGLRKGGVAADLLLHLGVEFGGVIGIASTPSVASFSFTAGACSAFCSSWLSFATISGGVFAGANTPIQNV